MLGSFSFLSRGRRCLSVWSLGCHQQHLCECPSVQFYQLLCQVSSIRFNYRQADWCRLRAVASYHRSWIAPGTHISFLLRLSLGVFPFLLLNRYRFYASNTWMSFACIYFVAWWQQDRSDACGHTGPSRCTREYIDCVRHLWSCAPHFHQNVPRWLWRHLRL